MRPLALALLALSACATLRAPEPAATGGAPGELLREAELARVRCLVVAPLENASDAPLAAGAATKAVLSGLDPGRTRALPVEELRALFADTPLELPEGVSGATAVELAELLRADGALWGTVEGRARERTPELLVTLRLALAGDRDLLFATSVRVTPLPGEKVEAAVRRAVLDRARPMLERLGAPGRSACFPKERRDHLRAAAVALRAPPIAAPAPPPVLAAAAPAARPSPRSALRTQRQRDWARKLADKGRLVLDDVTFAGRTGNLSRDGGLADLALVLAASPDLTVRIDGYVDATGDPAEDARVSYDMVKAAAQRLIDLGVEGSRVGTAGHGGENPLLPNFTARGRAANRRLEVASPR